MTNKSPAERAFQLAKDIRILMGELIEELDELATDESIPQSQRHLIMKQVTSFYSDRNSAIDKYAKDYLEESVEPVCRLSIPGVSLGDGELYVSGMVYDYKPVHKVEILNKDDDAAWTALVIALAKAGYACAIQKRLTASYFVGEKGEAALAAAQGLLACTTDGNWSITKPKELKTSRQR